jgi:hypothetical protein
MDTEDGRIEIFTKVAREELRNGIGADLAVDAEPAPPPCGFDISVA